MRHKNSGRKLSRTPAHRRALLRNMVTSLIKHERLETTVPKAKELRRVAERFITLGGTDTLAARRRAYAYIFDKAVVHKLFADIGPRYKERPGGYTRVLRSGIRKGDAAEMAVIELVETAAPPAKKKSAAKKKRAASKSKSESKPVEQETAAAGEQSP